MKICKVSFEFTKRDGCDESQTLEVSLAKDHLFFHNPQVFNYMDLSDFCNITDRIYELWREDWKYDQS